ncbi:MAG: GEVED domain-containing protein, partial [Xanthomarina sp.]
NKNIANGGAYNVQKERVSLISSRRIMKLLRGNDNNTMAVSFLKFNESAYNKTGANPDFSVSIDVEFKGNGLTAIALGLLAPEVDGGDAPISYGNPLHLIQKLDFTPDNIGAVNPGDPSFTNINTIGYTPGALIQNTDLSHLGSTAPDTESVILHSSDALGDDNFGPAGNLEEDAWPAEYKRFSYKVQYMPGNIISANIPYKSKTDGYIAGWIDFNGNGVFDPDEKREAFAPATGAVMGTVNLEWIVPATRKPYNTFVRLRLSELPDMTPDSFLNTGEVEDHKIFILVPTVTNPMIHSKAKDNH